MKTNGTRYSPALKFQVVLEVLKAEGRGAEAQVAQRALTKNHLVGAQDWATIGKLPALCRLGRVIEA